MTFYQKVYRVARRIPPGKVATYGQIALLCGSPRASRVVGGAMHNSPPDVPAHRVLSKGGFLAPEGTFGGVPDAQKILLQQEGVEVLAGQVDLNRFGWDGILPENIWGEE